MYGPKGVGALYVRRKNPRVRLKPILTGGGQERGFRSGTLNVPGIVGMGKAAELAIESRAEDQVRIQQTRNAFEDSIRSIGGITINGAGTARAAGFSSISMDGIGDAHALLERLPDLALSTGSACTTAVPEPSHVLRAMGLTVEQAKSSIRVSFGRNTSLADSKDAAERIKTEIHALREAALA